MVYREKVYIVELALTVDGKPVRARNVLRAKSKTAAVKKVLAGALSVRRATVDDLLPPVSSQTDIPEPGITPEPSNE